MMMRICRFCSKYAPDDELLKYSTRHYAHPECYLDAGKPLSALNIASLRRIPNELLQQRGLLADSRSLIDEARKAG